MPVRTPPVTLLDYACGPLPLVADLGVFVPPNRQSEKQCYLAHETKAWPSHSSISYSFIDNTDSVDDEVHFLRQELVTKAINEFTRYANVDLVLAQKGEEGSADIRISFKDTKSVWSAIGTDALKIPKGDATMNLGFLSRKPNDNERKEFYDLTLHQFGHAFGLAHEWDRGWSSLIGEEESEAIRQHKAAFEHDNTSNFPETDAQSIMKFFVPAKYSQDNREVPLEGGLSARDKAWLTLMYPGKAGPVPDDPEDDVDLDKKSGKESAVNTTPTDGDTSQLQETGILRALMDLGVPIQQSSRILLGPTVSEMRFSYHDYISKKYGHSLGNQVMRDIVKSWGGNAPDLKPETHVLEGKVSGMSPLVDHNTEDDLYDTVAAALMSPQFSNALANVVSKYDDGQSGSQNAVSNAIPNAIPSTIPSGASADVQNSLGLLLPLLGQLLLAAPLPPTGVASAVNPNALPADIQQGVFNMFTSLLKNPAFINVVKGVAGDLLSNMGKNQSSQ